MTPMFRKILLSIGILGGLACFARAEPPLPGVEDGAKLFKPETLAKAREEIREVRDTLHQDLSIETIPSVPEADNPRVHRMTSGQLARYFDKWAKERAGAAGVDGVYVLICTDPRHVQVIVWPESRDKTFPARDREDLRKYLAKQLNKEPDQTLLSAVAQVRAAIQARQPVEPVSYSTFWIVGGVILAFLTVWLILGLMRSKLASRDQTEDVAGSSASYVPGLLGGMFGSLAGYWIYDRLFHGGPSKPTASEDVAYDGSKQTPADPALNDNENAPV